MIRPVQAIVRRNLLKFVRDRMRLFLSLFMSGILLFVFSYVTRSAVSGLEHPMNYLISGIVIMTVFQTALNGSMGILEDISSGFMKEILVSPVRRWQIALGQVLSSSIIACCQGVIIMVAGLFLGLRIDPLHGVLALGLMGLSGLTFSALGLYLASLTKDSSNFQMVVTLVSFPLTFLSGAYIPVTMLPGILRPVVWLNPLTYTTAAFRAVVLGMESLPTATLVKVGIAIPLGGGGLVVMPLASALMVLAMGAAFLVLCVRRFSRADFSSVKVFRRHR